MKIYAVYEEYQDEKLTTGDIDFFSDKEEAIANFNARKDQFQHSDDWNLSDEFDAEDVTDSDNAVLFIHKTSGLEAYVNIETINVKAEDSQMKTYAIWKNKKVVGYIQLTEEQADALNSIKDIGVYFGFDKTTAPEKYE